MILFVEAGAGVSGDMLLAAFLDMGLPMERLRQVLEPLGLGRVRIQRERLSREGVAASRISIRGDLKPIPRRAGDWIRLLENSVLEESLKRPLTRAFVALGRAEGAAHGRPWRKAHFHQLRRVDTWVDLAGLCVGLSHFGIREVYTSPVPIGSRHQDSRGRWQARSGPATERLLRRFPTVRREELFEWTTPTGAVFLSAFATAGPAPPFEVLKIGHGVGHGRPPHGPTVLRLLLGRPIMRLT